MNHGTQNIPFSYISTKIEDPVIIRKIVSALVSRDTANKSALDWQCDRQTPIRKPEGRYLLSRIDGWVNFQKKVFFSQH